MRSIRNCKIIYWFSRIALLILIVDLYFTKTDMSVFLLKYEIKNGFIDNERWPIVAISILVLYILESVVNYLIVIGKVRLIYNITISKPRVKKYKIYVTNLLRMINVFMVLVSLATIVIVGFDTTIPKSNDYKWTKEKIIGHSFGTVNSNTNTGYLEAFEEKYDKGIRTFEVNSLKSSDDDNSLSLDDLLLIMKKYSDVWIVIDINDQELVSTRKYFEDIVKTAEEADCEDCLERIIVQFYSKEAYKAIRRIYEFNGYIFNLNSIWDGTFEQYRILMKWCASNDIHIIAMQSVHAEDIDIITYAKMYDIDIFVDVVNDVNEAKERLYDGVKGIYTDDITPEILK